MSNTVRERMEGEDREKFLMASAQDKKVTIRVTLVLLVFVVVELIVLINFDLCAQLHTKLHFHWRISALLARYFPRGSLAVVSAALCVRQNVV